MGRHRRCALLTLASLLGACSTAGTVLQRPGSAEQEAGAALSDGGGGADVTLDVANDAAGEVADLDAGPLDGAPADGTVADAPSALTSLTVSTGSLVPAFDPTVTDYAMTSLNSVYPIAVTATASDPHALLTIHDAPAQSGVAASFKLAAGEDFTVSLASGPTYTVHYLPPDWPAYTITTDPDGGSMAGTEDVLMTTLSYQLIVDHSGAPLYYRSFAPSVVFDFQPFTLPDGGLAYTSEVGASPTVGWIDGVDP